MHVYNTVGATSGLLLQLAIEKAGSIDQAKVREALSTMDVTTFYGTFKWDAKGNNVKGRLGSLQIQRQKAVSVDPLEAGAKVVYPAPAWSKR